MNYHTEHHMYPSVPFYNLKYLHNDVKNKMPKILNGIYNTWKQILKIQKIQRKDPSYKFKQSTN